MISKVIDILSDFTETDISKINKETQLIKDLGLNSLDVVTLVVAFEDEFDIEIPDSTIKSFTTVGSIVEYLENNT